MKRTVSTVSFVTQCRKLQRFIHRKYPRLPLVMLVFSCLLQLLDLVLYGTILTLYQPKYNATLSNTETPLWAFVVRFCLAVYFFLTWAVEFLLEEYRLPLLLSFPTLVSCLTCIPQIICGMAALRDPSWINAWVPLYLHIWGFHGDLLQLLDYPYFSTFLTDLHRELIRSVVSLLATMITAIGTFQASESFSSQKTVTLFDSAYFIVVTFGTIGYGDITPSTTISRVITVCIIIVAIYQFPLFFNNLAEITTQKPRYHAFSSNSGLRRHVIVVGSLRDRDVTFFLNEFFTGSRRYIDINVIFMSDVEYTQETVLLVSSPMYRSRVSLIVGDSSKRSDLERCDAAFADAIFLVSQADEGTSFSDYDVVLRSMSVNQFDPNLPQYVLLQRQRNTKFVAPIATCVMEKERMKCTLLGLGAVLPGMIPLVVNLIRTYDPEEDAQRCRTWLEQYDWSLGNELYIVPLPAELYGLNFPTLAHGLFRSCVTPLGVIGSDGELVLNPMGMLSSDTPRLIVIAADVKDATNAIEQCIEDLRDGLLEPIWVDEAASPRIASKVARLLTPPPSISEHVVHHRSSIAKDVIDAARDAKRTVEQIANANLVNDHFVLIDLSSAYCQPSMSPEASEEAEHFAASDLFNVIRPVKQMYPEKEIVLLSRNPPNSYFTRLWAHTELPPILHITGCGLNVKDLQKCHTATCFACVVFSTGESNDHNADAMTMIVTLSLHEIHKGSVRLDFPVVSEIAQLDSLGLFAPYYTDDRMSSMAEDNWAFQPNFVIGDAMCSTMLDPALYQCFFTPQLLKVIDKLMHGEGDAPLVLRMTVVATPDNEQPLPSDEGAPLRTYGDLCKMYVRRGLIPLGLHRAIHDENNRAMNGRRFMLTNPPPSLRVFPNEDIVYFINRW
jgi:hypothetical protein